MNSEERFLKGFGTGHFQGKSGVDRWVERNNTSKGQTVHYYGVVQLGRGVAVTHPYLFPPHAFVARKALEKEVGKSKVYKNTRKWKLEEFIRKNPARNWVTYRSRGLELGYKLTSLCRILPRLLYAAGVHEGKWKRGYLSDLQKCNKDYYSKNKHKYNRKRQLSTQKEENDI